MKDIPHICVVCGVSVMKSVLARHMKIHDEVAQFRCEICDKRKQKTICPNIKRHIGNLKTFNVPVLKQKDIG